MRRDFNEGWRFCRKKDGVWLDVRLPHDAMLTEKRSPKAEGKGASGYFPGGSYVYEKVFVLPSDIQEKHVTFEFEGVYRNAQVQINGEEAGGCSYGYLPFYVCADGLLKAGENVIRVEMSNERQPDSRWYSGAGIYRPVWMHVQEKTYIEPEGIRIRTVSLNPAKIEVKTEHQGGDVAVHILKDGTKIAEGKGYKIIQKTSKGETFLGFLRIHQLHA